MATSSLSLPDRLGDNVDINSMLLASLPRGPRPNTEEASLQQLEDEFLTPTCSLSQQWLNDLQECDTQSLIVSPHARLSPPRYQTLTRIFLVLIVGDGKSRPHIILFLPLLRL